MQSGTVVAERFEIERHASSGGMGAVYRARDRHTGATVALKVMLIGEPTALVERDRFEREARALAELRHPGIVRYDDHGVTHGGELYLAMEWLEGEDLAQRLQRARLGAKESLRLAQRVAETLAPAHQRGVIHRDIKPSNLFLPGHDLDRVRILDFGVARFSYETHAATRSGTLLGTPGYMAPEQARGDREIDARVDVFALGCVLFECLTGRPAFKGEHVMAVLAKILLEEAPRVRELRPEIPEAIDALVARMMAKDRTYRPPHAGALSIELAALVEVAPDLAAPITDAPPRSSITAGEQTVVSVVVAAEAYGNEAAMAATLTPEAAGSKVDRLRESVAPYGARLEMLADGSWVAALGARGGAASDRAAQAARCALAMRHHMPTAPMVLATGRAIFAGKMPVGEVIDRATRLLRPMLKELRDAREAPPSSSAPVSSGRPRPIRIDDVTTGLLDVRFDVSAPDDDHEVLELRGEREVVDRTRTLLGKATAFVGRERELGLLEATFAECIGEPIARCVVVTAPAGVGKSRLRYELVKKLQARGGIEVWIGRGDPVRAGSPFAMIAPAIRRSAGILDGEALGVRQKKLAARIGRHVPVADRARVTDFIGELAAVPFGDHDKVQLRAARADAMVMGDQKLRAFEDFLGAECDAQPVLLILEDLHWGDQPSVKFIDAALRTLREAPLMVLALARPEVHERFPKLWEERGVQTLSLVELSPKRSTQLVRQILGATVESETVARIVERAQGNAFYLEELIRAFAEGGSRSPGGDDLPETVLAMVQGRLERLEPDARRLLRAASVFGVVFWRRGVLALLGDLDDPSRANEWLESLVEREVITKRSAGATGKFPDEDEFSFRHALVRDAAYAMLTEEDRRLGHRLAGDWLERAGEHEAVVLAEHFERGGDVVHAVSAYRRAAEQALEANDLDSVIARAERAIASGASGETLGALRSLQAEAHRWRGKFGEAKACALAALDLLPRSSDAWSSAAAEVALAGGRLGDHEQLIALLARLREVPLTAASSRACLTAWIRTAGQLLLAGRRDAADPVFEEVERVGQSASLDPTITARLALVRGIRALFAGDAGAYRMHIGHAAESFQRGGDLRSACMQRASVGYASLGLGDWEQAERVLREALASAERMGLTNVVAYSKNNLGLALSRRAAEVDEGKRRALLDEARKIETEAMVAFVAQGDGRLEHSSHVYLAIILMLSGELEGAEREARTAVEFFRAASPLRAYALATLAEVQLARGAPASALESAEEAMKLLEALGHLEEGEALARLVHAEALHRTGAIELAAAAITKARDQLLSRAAKITDAAWRSSFLTRVPENARTLALAEEWTGVRSR